MKAVVLSLLLASVSIGFGQNPDEPQYLGTVNGIVLTDNSTYYHPADIIAITDESVTFSCKPESAPFTIPWSKIQQPKKEDIQKDMKSYGDHKKKMISEGKWPVPTPNTRTYYKENFSKYQGREVTIDCTSIYPRVFEKDNGRVVEFEAVTDAIGTEDRRIPVRAPAEELDAIKKEYGTTGGMDKSKPLTGILGRDGHQIFLTYVKQ